MRRKWIWPLVLAAAVAAAVAVARVDGVRRAVAPGPPGGEVRLARVLPDVRIEAGSLDEAVAALGRISGTRIVVNTAALDNARIDRSHGVELKARGITLSQALHRVFACYDPHFLLSFAADGDSVLVSTEADLGRYAVVRAYDVRDLLPPPGPPVARTPEELFGRNYMYYQQGPPGPPRSARETAALDIIDLLLETVAPDSWVNSGAAGSIRETDGRLVVVQTRRNQEHVAHLLDELRGLNDADQRAVLKSAGRGSRR